MLNKEEQWFIKEVEKIKQIERISRANNIKAYLMGAHEVLSRKDFFYKKDNYKTSKIVLQNIKNIIKFHTNYILGDNIALVGNGERANHYNAIMRKGGYRYINKKVLDNLIKFGEAFEYVYKEGSTVKSKIIDNAESYPVYDNEGNYIRFIESWKDETSERVYYNVYNPNYIEKYECYGEALILVNNYLNISGLPIHYKNNDNEHYTQYGYSILNDLIPIMDKIEFLLSKMDDAIYLYSLNPMPIISGQRIETTVDADALGYILNLEDGAEFKHAVATLDHQSIKLLLDTLYNNLYDVANVPSVLFKNTNIANVSEVSLSLMFSRTDMFANDVIYSMQEGFDRRFEFFDSLTAKKWKDEAYVNAVFTTKKPIDSKEMMDNMKTQYDMGAISVDTIIEKSPYTENIEGEKERLGLNG